MSRSIILSLTLAACATGTPIDQTQAPVLKSGVRVADSSPQMPARRIRLEMPTAHQMASSAKPLTASVEMCVSSAGETRNVQLRHSSGDRMFDDAVVYDVERLHYRPGSDECEQVVVTFNP